jgi:hypothetical protein
MCTPSACNPWSRRQLVNANSCSRALSTRTTSLNAQSSNRSGTGTVSPLIETDRTRHVRIEAASGQVGPPAHRHRRRSETIHWDVEPSPTSKTQKSRPPR